MIIFNLLICLSLLSLISATTLSEKNHTNKILLEKKSGDLHNEMIVKVLPEYDEAIHGPGKAFRMLSPQVESLNRKLQSFNFSLLFAVVVLRVYVFFDQN